MTKGRITFPIGAVLAVSLGAPAFGQPLIVVTPNPPTPVAPTPVAPATVPASKAVGVDDHGHDPNKMICKREVEIGSRLGGVQVCHTRGDWTAISRDAAKQFEDAQMSGARANVANTPGAFGK